MKRWLVGAALISASCGGVVSGGQDAGGTGDDSATSGDVLVEAGTSDLAGTWVGYVESYKFPSGSDAVTFQISGVVAGTVTFGGAPPPPAPTDPNGAYPPGLVSSMMQAPAPSQYLEGFVLTMLAGSFDGARLKLGVQSTQVFKAWCELQTQIWGNGGDGGAPYSCLPNWGYSGDGTTCSSTNPANSSQTITYTCEKLGLCGGVCECTLTSCTVPVTAPTITFDMVYTPGKLDGSITGDLGDKNVHLKKQ